MPGLCLPSCPALRPSFLHVLTDSLVKQRAQRTEACALHSAVVFFFHVVWNLKRIYLINETHVLCVASLYISF